MKPLFFVHKIEDSELNVHDLEQMKVLLSTSVDKDDLISRWTFKLVYDNLCHFHYMVSKKWINDNTYSVEDWQLLVNQYENYNKKNHVDNKNFEEMESILEYTQALNTSQAEYLYRLLYFFIVKIYSILNNEYHQKIFHSLKITDQEFHRKAKITLTKYPKPHDKEKSIYFSSDFAK